MANADVYAGPDQIKAARALLRWRQQDLATKSGLSIMSIKNIERGATDPRVSTMRAIHAALAAAGIAFADGGVKLIG